jgi:hypothetical protein
VVIADVAAGRSRVRAWREGGGSDAHVPKGEGRDMTDSVSTDQAAILRAARARIADPAHWTKGAFARTANVSLDERGTGCNAVDPRATCWCAEGAIRFVTNDDRHAHEAVGKLLELAVDPGGRLSIATFNDSSGTTHADVLAAFDRAIAIAEGARYQ